MEKGRSFENKVANLFTLWGYHVKKDLLIAGRQVDLLIEYRSGPFSHKYIVECKDQASPVTSAQYDSFLGKINAAKKEIDPKLRGIIVSSVGFVKEVKAQSNYNDIELIAISELEKSIIDFSSYVQNLILNLENDTALKYFVEPEIRRENLALAENAYAVLNEWLSDPILNQLTLLGDYGTGKTTLLKHFALTMAKRYKKEVLEEGGRGRVPLFIDLREYTQAISLKQIILDLLDSHSIKSASYSAFEYVLKEGQVLLILDGFDEMASRGNYQETLVNFKELNKNAMGSAKIILSCRTHYFTTDQDVLKFHGQLQPRKYIPKSYTDLYREIATRQNFLITHLMEFEPKQVKQYLRQRCGNNWESVRSFIDSTYNLTELSRRPVLLDMIVSVEGNVDSTQVKINPGILYQVYTDIWLSENDWSSIIDISDKYELLERFAYLASANPEFKLNYKDIPNLIKKWKPDIEDLDAMEIDRELRTASFLVRDREGYYKFSHKSFQEFFYSRFLLSEAYKGNSRYWSEGFFSTEIYRFIRDILHPIIMDREIPPYKISEIKVLVDWLNDKKQSDYVMANVIKCLSGISDEKIKGILKNVLKESEGVRARRSAATALGYLPGKEVVQILIETAQKDTDPLVRTNSLIAIGRLNDQRGNSFLISVLLGEINCDKIVRWAFIEAAKDFDNELIRHCISTAPLVAKNRSTIEAALNLCKFKWCKEAEEYCVNILKTTESPILAMLAFRIIKKQKYTFIPKIFSLIEKYKEESICEKLIMSLKGILNHEVEQELCLIVENSYDRNAIAALDVLSSDYPKAIINNAKNWMRKGRFYKIRTIVAKVYAKYYAPNKIDDMIILLAPIERVSTRREILKLIFDYYSDLYPSVVYQIWNSKNPPTIKKYSLELLWKIDRNSARALILGKGLNDSRIGTRVAACSILGVEKSEKITKILLGLLRTDYSKWVRLQALRSLCSPGRNVAKADINKALETETDKDVISLRKELIG